MGDSSRNSGVGFILKRNMRRILYLGGFELPNRNAAAQRVLSVAKTMREVGCKVMFIGVTKQTDEIGKEQEYEGFKCLSLKYSTSLKDWFYTITRFIPSNKIYEIKPDFVVLYNFPAIASLKVLRICHKNGIKVIHDLTEWEQTVGYSPRDIIKRLDTALRIRYCMKKMDGVIAISRFLYNIYKDEVKTILMPPTVDLSNKKWNRDRDISINSPITLVYAGSPGAGVKDRLDLVIDAVKDRMNLRLRIIGLTENQYEKLFNKAHTHYNNIEFIGRLPHEDAITEVCNADFQMLIRDRNRKNEAGFPTKFVESMACGTPVISTVFSNILAYLHDGENGFVINNSQSLSDILNKIVVMDAVDIIKMKKKCIEMKVFDYHYYKSEFEKLFN